MSEYLAVSYYRVSTRSQGADGRGIQAQQDAVREFLGGRWELLAEFIEVAGATRSDQPILMEAVRLCRERAATLVVASLDRLSRNVAFVEGLPELGVSVLTADQPWATHTDHVRLAGEAAREASKLSERTKAALAAAKVRGKKLGGDRGNLDQVRALGTVASIKVRQERADTFAHALFPRLNQEREQGDSLRVIADGLMRAGVPSPRGGVRWDASQVARVLQRGAPEG